MAEISAAWKTRFQKKVFPAIWFAFLAIFFVVVTGSGAAAEQPAMALLPLVLAVCGFFIMRHLAWNLVDEVHDHGDYLIVRNGDDGERIEIADIMNVSADPFLSRQRITLRLRRASRFGQEISFMPVVPFSLNPLARSPIADDLIERVDRARRTESQPLST